MPEKEPKFPMLEESTVDILNICLTDDTPELSIEPKYDEYTDDYYIVFCRTIHCRFFMEG
jgi:hypothetical protein